MNFLSLITVIVFSTVVVKVESGDYLIRDGIGYYVSYPDKGNWLEAMRFCAYNKIFLVDILSPYENERILGIINETEAKYNNPKENYWTSGNDIGHHMRFIWSTTGAQIVWHDFDVGQPDNGRFNMEHCVDFWYEALIRLKWNDALCSNEVPFICRDRLDVPLINASSKVGWVKMED